jgi:DNA-binding IclR family transcriptional regulator
MKPRSTENTLATTRISLEMLEHVVQREGATLDDLAAATDLAKSTVHNHVSTLLEFGYLVREDRTYYPGLKLYHFGDFARKRSDLYPIAQTVVTDLAEQTGLEVDFTIEENGRIVSLYDQWRSADIPSYLVDYRIFHVHCNASGKAILAEYPEPRVREILDRWGMERVTEETITDVEAFLAELERVRQRGYAINMNESMAGMWAISKVVTRSDGGVAGSLNVAGPAYVHSEQRERAVADELADQVQEFERQLVEEGTIAEE